MAKVKQLPVVPVPVEDEDDDNDKKCPPVGAPAWMATFADIATLLMAFFVLILSFAEFNQPRFKLLAGSLREAFGVQRVSPVVEPPKGTTILDMSFSPSPDPSFTDEMTQQTTETEQTELDKKDGETDTESEAELKAAIMDAMETVLQEINSQANTAAQEAPSEEAQEAQAQARSAAEALGEVLTKAALGETEGSANTAENISESLREFVQAAAEVGQSQQDSEGEAEGTGQSAESRASIADSRLQVALREEIDEGLVTVERDKDSVFITVGAGGAFRSGSADLTEDARGIMARLALAAAGSASNIIVTGHTDNVPLTGGVFQDNWGLAAGRASSVVRELEASGLISQDRLIATSKGETSPVATNDTADGREQNRRIEIEIKYDSRD